MYSFTALSLAEPSKSIRKFVFITLFIITALLLLLFLPWRQTVQGVAKLTALNPSQRDYKVLATIDGFIEKFYIKENQFVHKGDKLFSMLDLDTHYQSRLENIKKQTEAKHSNETQKLEFIEDNLLHRQSILDNGIKVYDKQIKQLSNELHYLEEQLKVIQNRLKFEQKNYQRYQSLHKEGIESQREVDLKRDKFLQAQASLKKIKITLQNRDHELKITQDKKMKFEYEMKLKLNEIQHQSLSIKNNLSTLKQNIHKNETLIARYLSRDILAKSDGYVVRIYQNDTNKLLKRGEDILYFSPIVTKRALRLKVSDFHMPLMKVGLKSRIIFYGWPAIQIPGWPHISHGTYGGVISSIERSTHESGVYYVMVTEDPDDSPWPEAKYLRIGTQASVWTLLDVVTIWYEIWRLMIAQPPKMVKQPQVEFQKW